MSKEEKKMSSFTTKNEDELRAKFYELFKNNPIFESEIMINLGLFLSRQALSQILFANEIYQKILNVQGSIFEFGVRWGQNLALFESLRGIYEPYNYNRKIYGFDTFKGFPSVHAKDTSSSYSSQPGEYSVSNNYDEYLEQVLNYHESESPLSHIKKYELIKGDATVTIDKFLEENPHLVVALAYFDFDIYEPTRKCFEAILPYFTKGSVIVFDEVNHPHFPGETMALNEIIGLNKIRIQRSQYKVHSAYFIYE